MVRFKSILFLLFLMPFLASAGSPLKKILVEFPVKSECQLPDNIQSLLLINRTVDERYSNLPADSLQILFYKQGFSLDTTIYDLTAVDTSLQALGALLFESGRYDIVVPDNPFYKSRKDSSGAEAMSWKAVDQLCEKFNTDAVLSMDMFETEVATILQEYVFTENEENASQGLIETQMAIAYKALFRIYSPKNQTIYANEMFVDTLFWDKKDISINAIFNGFTSVKQALVEAGINMAIDYSDKISPFWEQHNRMIFAKGDDDFEKAAVLVDSVDWDGAISIWQEMSIKEQSKSKQSKILFNLAVAYEIQGSLNRAIKYATDSYNTMYRQITYEYLEELGRRKKQFQKQ